MSPTDCAELNYYRFVRRIFVLTLSVSLYNDWAQLSPKDQEDLIIDLATDRITEEEAKNQIQAITNDEKENQS